MKWPLAKGKLCVNGGEEDDECYPCSALAVVEEYYPVHDEWTALPPLPLPKKRPLRRRKRTVSLNEFRVVAIGGAVYVLGGNRCDVELDCAEEGLSTVYRFWNGEWTQLSSMRTSGSEFYVQGIILTE